MENEPIQERRITPKEQEKPKPKAECGTCRFFSPGPPGVGSGLCKRFPPAYNGTRVGYWPSVLPESHCGEHQFA